MPGGITSGHASSLHSKSAVITFNSVNVQLVSAENVAAKPMASPSAGRVTSTNVCGDIKPTAETEAVPSPVKFNVPVAGALVNVTVISAVNVSSVKIVGVPLSLHESIFEDAIAVISQTAFTVSVAQLISLIHEFSS